MVFNLNYDSQFVKGMEAVFASNLGTLGTKLGDAITAGKWPVSGVSEVYNGTTYDLCIFVATLDDNKLNLPKVKKKRISIIAESSDADFNSACASWVSDGKNVVFPTVSEARGNYYALAISISA